MNDRTYDIFFSYPHKDEKEVEYLFSWDEIPGNDSDKLIEVLKQKFGIDWVKTAEIEKIDNGNTIKVSTEINYLSLNLNQEKTEVIFKIDDVRTDKLIAKMENGKLNIYEVEKVNQILEALRAKKLRVWIDHSEIQDYASITRSIIEGVAHSKVLLAYNSLNYAHSRACQWELTAAFLAAQREGDPRQRVLIINPEENAEHIHPVELRDVLFQKANADPLAIDSLTTSVATYVSAIEGTIGEIKPLIRPRWFGKKGTGSNRFVGRLPDMWHIHSSLHSGDFLIYSGSMGHGKKRLTAEDAENRRGLLFFSASLGVLCGFPDRPEINKKS